jgi:molybdopterin-guanine dinucleotide biosynthesis protein B
MEVYRANHCTELACPTEVLIAVATDTKLDIDIPQLELNDVTGIADFIESYLQTNQTNEAVLFINGKQIFMKEFVRDIISEAIVGMVKTLKGMDEIKNVDISIRRGGSSGTINE